MHTGSMHPAGDELATLRRGLVERLRSQGVLSDDAVAAAIARVPRHLFVPGAPAAAYRDAVIATKWDADGQAISSSSQPGMMALMLQQLAVDPGHRVLEIGAGTGYNAALLAILAGPAGRVTTVDIDEDLVRAARDHLAAAGIGPVEVVRGDGADGWPAGAPYDRIELTVAADDLAPAWREQLAPGGRLVLPLALRAVQRSVALVADGDGGLESRSISDCAFMPLRGSLAARRTRVVIDGAVALEAPDDRALDREALAAALRRPGAAVACGVAVRPHELWGGLGLWIAVADADAGRLLVTPGWGRRSLRPAERTGGVALVGDGSFANLERTTGVRGRLVGLAARPFGPGGGPLAERLAKLVRAWRDHGRPASADARIRVLPAGAAAPADGAAVVPTRHAQVLVRW